MNSSREQHLPLYISQPHNCVYLPEQQSTSLFVDPAFEIDTRLYLTLLQNGFRRSGDLVYRPHCQQCSACIPVRIPVERFVYSHSQKRVWRKNQDLELCLLEPEFSDEHFELYKRYQQARHNDGSMNDPDPEKYRNFLLSRHINGLFLELRLDGVLAMIAIVDQVNDGLSAVYTFFDPALSSRSLGVYGILLEIEYARRNRLDWLYLGYWIKGCRKMSYKNQYRPFQVFHDDQWQDHEAPPDTHE
jgi:leucyl-tRNA---protein transferase